MNFQNASIYVEVKYQPQAQFLIKVANENNSNSENNDLFIMSWGISMRMGAGDTWSTIKTVYDVDLILEQLNLCLGIELKDNELTSKHKSPSFRCMTQYIVPVKNDVLKSIEIDYDKLQLDRNVVDACITKSQDERCSLFESIAWLTVKSRIQSSSDRLGTSLDKALSYLKFNFNDS
jgi:hypothetical protein